MTEATGREFNSPQVHLLYNVYMSIPSSDGTITFAYNTPVPGHGTNMEVLDVEAGGTPGAGQATAKINVAGPQGPIGPQGPVGATGPQGPQGPQGPSAPGWSTPQYSFNAQAITTAGSNFGQVLDFGAVQSAVAVQWHVDNPSQIDMTLRLEGSLDGINYFDMGIDLGLHAGGTQLAPTSLDGEAVASVTAARWVRANAQMNQIPANVVVTAIVVAKA